jgi:hypothetical protein
MSQCNTECAPPAPPVGCRENYGWVDRDSYATFAASQRSVAETALARTRGTVRAPQLVPGTIYGVQYDSPFSYTRVGDTNCWVQPDSVSHLQYCWRGVCQVAPQYRTNNYMYVVGYVNGTQRRQVLLLFYNPGSTLASEGCCDPSKLNQSVWLPAVYSYDTGTIFSEIGLAQVEGTSEKELCWTSVSNDYIRMDDSTMGKVVGYARVQATELCDGGQIDIATAWLRFILCQFMKAPGSQFASFVDLSAVLYAMENGGDVISRPACAVPQSACCPPSATDYTVPQEEACPASTCPPCPPCPGMCGDWDI